MASAWHEGGGREGGWRAMEDKFSLIFEEIIRSLGEIIGLVLV